MRLAESMKNAVERVRHCNLCNTFTEAEICEICASARRDKSLLCVVETPGDLLMMEQTQTYRGLYFVLMGRLSPLDGIGPKDIHLERLTKRAVDGLVKEGSAGLSRGGSAVFGYALHQAQIGEKRRSSQAPRGLWRGRRAGGCGG